ncbi:hypothetical protein GT002_31965, partial [Streptomyces sp. SID4917]|nr:hypothetical protein [Streptomyces sp. SID4917]
MTARDREPDGIDEALALVAEASAAPHDPGGHSGRARGEHRSDDTNEGSGTDQEQRDHGAGSGATAAIAGPSASAAGQARAATPG